MKKVIISAALCAVLVVAVSVQGASAQVAIGSEPGVPMRDEAGLIALSPEEKAAIEAAGKSNAPVAPIPLTPPVVRVPDEDDIVAKTLSSTSPYFFRKMMVRYMAGDVTLTDEHYYYLYYGYAYDDAYDAHRELPGWNTMIEIFTRAGEKPSREDALALIAAGRRNMLVDPFSPGNINMMTWAYEMVGDTINAKMSGDRFRKILRAIQSSGTGDKENSPWHILRFSHANDLVAAQGLTIVNNQVRSIDVEYIQVDRNRQKVKGYFFDFSRVYWKPFEGERVKRKSRWEFNGMPL